MSDEYYDEGASLKQEIVAKTPDMAGQRRQVLSQLDLKAGERVLDIGSGNGILAREMLREVGESGKVVGVDPADSMISMSRNLCPEALFLKGDSAALPVDSGQFDAVTASQVLCFVPDIDAALAEMFRVLRASGRLVILDTDWETLLWNCNDRELLSQVVGELTRAYASAHVPRSLSKQLVRAGFEVTERKSYPIVNWEFAEDSYSAQLASFLPTHDNEKHEDDFALGPAWIAELSEVAASGEYMFSLNRYVFSARKAQPWTSI